MEKTVQITIGSTAFSLTEAAYAKLSAYLDGIKAHFAQEPEGAEILRDIEARIAEKLYGRREGVVTEADIAAVVAEIGDASAFDDAGDGAREAPRAAAHKLYRDMDNAWLGGVAAGLGAYFDIDPLWIRLGFLATVFFGGTGVLLYIALWILVPEAKSAGQKLEMRGAPVDIEGITRIVKESMENVRESGAIGNFARGVQRGISAFFRILGKVVGFALVVGAFVALIALTVGLGIVLTNWNAPYNDFPLRDVVSLPLLLTGLIAGYVAVFIPLMAVLALGVRLIIKKTIVPGAVAFGLIGIWALALCTVATIGVRSAGEYFEYTRTSPDHQVTAQELELDAFSEIEVSRAAVVVRSGAEESVVLEGRAMDIGNVRVAVENGVLTITRVDHSGEMCIFCDARTPTIIVTTPDVDTVSVNSGSVRFEEYVDTALALDLSSANARGSIASESLDIRMESSSLRGTLETNSLTLDMRDSHAHLDGTAVQAMLSLEGSDLEAESFDIETARVSAEGSYAELDVSGELVRESVMSSRVTNQNEETER